MNKSAIIGYMNYVRQLAVMTANVTSNGVKRRTLLTFTGHGAELEIDLDVSTCSLTMPNDWIDGTSTPYASEAIATAALADQVVSCLIETTAGTDKSGLTASFASGVLTVAESGGTEMTRNHMCSASLGVGDVTLTYSLALNNSANGQTNLDLIDGTGTAIDSDVSTSPSGTLTVTVPSAGCYRIAVSSGVTPGPTPTTFAISQTITGPSMAMGAISALWDDGVDSGAVEC